MKLRGKPYQFHCETQIASQLKVPIIITIVARQETLPTVVERINAAMIAQATVERNSITSCFGSMTSLPCGWYKRRPRGPDLTLAVQASSSAWLSFLDMSMPGK